MPITAALFDFGGVILTSPFDAFATYEQDRGLPAGFIRQLNATNPDDNAWARFERSQLDVEGFCSAFEAEAEAAGQSVDAAEVLGLLAGQLRPEMVEAVRRCSQQLKTGLLTNNVVSMGTEAMAGAGDTGHAEVLALFDVVVESSKVGVRKPDPHFYALACELLDIEPEQAVFLDDLGVNLKPARALGMTTIKVTDPGEAIAQLESVVGFALG